MMTNFRMIKVIRLNITSKKFSSMCALLYDYANLSSREGASNFELLSYILNNIVNKAGLSHSLG